MAETHLQVDHIHTPEPQNQTTPLIEKAQNTHQEPKDPQSQSREHDENTHLDKTLLKLESFLALLGFNQSKVLSFFLSWLGFLCIGVVVPLLMLELSNCLGCEKAQIKRFEIDIVGSQALLGASSLLCLSHNLRKYGIRKFLFVDRYSGHMERFSDQYIEKIRESLRKLVYLLLPCLILKTTREVIRLLHVYHESRWHSIGILLAFLVSWTYVTTVFLSACIVFHLVCSLQIIHFEDYGKLLERESEAMVLIQEHVRLRHYLSKISHRFRIFVLLVFFIVTVSQFMTLFQTTGYSGMITFINSGDFAVSSIVQVVGITLCLNAAAKISHRAQGIGSVASKWHAYLTCSSSDTSQVRVSNSIPNFEAYYINNSESDVESLDITPMNTNTQLASYLSSYHKRQSLVTYLQSNPGGITIFGWTVDRGLINTIFFIELSLVLFVLGQTLVFGSR